ncbi:MAG: thioesterase family protein [Nevskia sp.]
MNDPTGERPRPLPRLRAAFPHWMQEQVRWSDTDLVGHVNNLSISTYFETGRTHFLLPVLSKKLPEPSLLLIASMTVNFLGEVHWPATVDIGSGLLGLGRSSCRMAQAVFDGERCVATADTTLVLIDEGSRRSRAIPEAMRRWFLEFELAAAA